MHALTRWFIYNPVAANLLMLLILIGGIFSAVSMRIEGFPRLPADSLVISTHMAGANSTQIDRQISQKIKTGLQGLPGVQQIESLSFEAYSSVSVKKKPGYSLQTLQDDIRTRLDSLAELPQAANKPTIERNDFDFPALIVQLYGSADGRTLQRIGHEVREALLALPEVSKLKVWGQKKPEIRIEVPIWQLEKYQLSIDDIRQKIQQASLVLKGGQLKSEQGKISLIMDSQAYYRPDFEKIVILGEGRDNPLLLKDIATIEDDFEQSEGFVRFNGQAALGLEVQIGQTENLLEISNAVKMRVSELQQTLPDTIKLSIWADSSGYISERLQLLQGNALQGLLLVFALLALFLNLRLAFWVAMGIPVSITGALAVMGSKWVDYSLNDITTFGLILALGILVDDAVVVGESVFEERARNTDPITGTEKGVRRVSVATTYGVLTSIAALFPMLLIDNALGKVLASFAGVVILTLTFSLIESKLILPAHLAKIPLQNHTPHALLPRLWHALQSFAQQRLETFNQKLYRPALKWSLNQRYAVLIVFITCAALGIGLIIQGKIKTSFFPDVPGQLITVNLEMDARAPLSLTLENASSIEDSAKQLNEIWQTKYQLEAPPIKDLLVVVMGAFSIEVFAEITAPAKRPELSMADILAQWQNQTGTLEGAVELVFSGIEETGGGFELELFGKNQRELQKASSELIEYLQSINGISGIRDDLKSGRPELSLKLKPEARRLGFSEATFATQLSQRFSGAEVQRIQRDRQETRLIVQLSAKNRQYFADLAQARLQNDQGQWFPLLSLAVIESAYSAASISRKDGARINRIKAHIDKNSTTAAEVGQSISKRVIPDLIKRFPSVSIHLAGELQEMEKLKGGLIRALIFTCLLIYVLMAIPLKSYWQPVIIMSIIPFGFVGAALGHLIMGLPLSVLSFFGMLALTGVVVNDSLVMITRYNQCRAKGAELTTALLDAGTGRFRAIFLTTVTTVAGLSPLMNETSEQAQYLIPAAVSLAFGEIFATAITLVLVPVLIAISNDMRRLIGNSVKKPCLITE